MPEIIAFFASSNTAVTYRVDYTARQIVCYFWRGTYLASWSPIRSEIWNCAMVYCVWIQRNETMFYQLLDLISFNCIRKLDHLIPTASTTDTGKREEEVSVFGSVKEHGRTSFCHHGGQLCIRSRSCRCSW